MAEDARGIGIVMAPAPRKRNAEEASVPDDPQVTPRFTAGQADHSFTLQAIMELQKTVGEMNANVTGMKSSVDSVKTKVDDLVAWKNKLLGMAIGVGGAVSIVTFLLTKSYMTIGTPSAPSAAASAAQAPATIAPVAPVAPSPAPVTSHSRTHGLASSPAP
jgi:hypothetical protein